MVSESSKAAVNVTAKLLGLDPNSLTEALTTRTMRSAGEANTIKYVVFRITSIVSGINSCK